MYSTQQRHHHTHPFAHHVKTRSTLHQAHEQGHVSAHSLSRGGGRKWHHNTPLNDTPAKGNNNNTPCHHQTNNHSPLTQSGPAAEEGTESSLAEPRAIAEPETEPGVFSAQVPTPAAPVKPKGRFVKRGETLVWWKEPRFRGSGRVVVLDDPVRDGRELARAIEDGWEVVGDGTKGLEEEGGDGKGLRVEEGERKGGFGFEEIVREGVGYTVREVKRKGRKGVEKKVAEEEEEEVFGEETGSGLQEGDDGPESAAESEVGSDSDSGFDCDFLFDFMFPKGEGKGWVPVMVAEEDEGDDWMSLTGSWVMMREGQGLGK